MLEGGKINHYVQFATTYMYNPFLHNSTAFVSASDLNLKLDTDLKI